MAPTLPFIILAILGIAGTLWNPRFILVTILSLTVLALREEFPEEKPLQSIKKIINNRDPYFDDPMYLMARTKSRIDASRTKLDEIEKRLLLHRLSKF